MAGAYRFATSRATITHPDGRTWKSATVTVRDGEVTVKRGATRESFVSTGDPVVLGAKHWSLPIEGGELDVVRSCGCGGGR